MLNNKFLYFVLFILTLHISNGFLQNDKQRYFTKQRLNNLREKVRNMFQHAYEGYLKYAYGYDELRPLTCDGTDTWGSYSLTLIDSLDTLATMGNYSEFKRVALLLEEKIDFDRDINVSVFETNIRILGGLLSAHLLSKRAGLELEEGWPCQGPLLRLAENIAKRLLPAFDTATGMPYGTVNLRYGVPKGETTITCTAGVGTFLIEFGALSRLTGNKIYEEVASNALYSLWERRSAIGLFGNHIDIQTGRWSALDSGIGAGVDSFFEYLVKGSIMLNRPNLMQMFHEARSAIDKYLKHDDWYVWVNMHKGLVTLPVFQSLEAFWPGILSMFGDNNLRTLIKYNSIWLRYGGLPEFFHILLDETPQNRESYPLRPELAESLMYLYRTTKNQYLLEMGENMVDSIETSAKTKCGYATIRNVVTQEKENRMESFFLAETTKYLYLLFDENNFMHNDASVGDLHETSNGQCVVNAGAYIFNTEAHPIDMSALYCCHNMQENVYEQGIDLKKFHESSLLKRDREKYLKNKQYTRKTYHTFGTPIQTTKETKINDLTMSVDIKVLDEHQNSMAEKLLADFKKVIENRTVVENETTKTVVELDENMPKHLTLSDLVNFFNKKREHFKTATEILNYVVNFMQTYTLDQTYIKGFRLFDKNIINILGAAKRKEYEQETKTLWQLYDLRQQYAINADLLINLDSKKFNYQKAILQIFEEINVAKNDGLDDKDLNNREEFEKNIAYKICEAKKKYQIALVNTTAMEEFLFDILAHGTDDNKRLLIPLLNDEEISQFSKPIIDEEKWKLIFKNLIRIVKHRKRVAASMEKLQKVLAINEDDETIIEETKKKFKTKHIDDYDNNVKIFLTDGTDNTISDSVWSQLVQAILRRTTQQSYKFDESQLMEKTRKSLMNYKEAEMEYELLTCQRQNFTDNFWYRDICS